MNDAHRLAGRPLVEWLTELNSKIGAVRLRASAVLLRDGSRAVPKILATLAGREDSVMESLWGSVLLQTIYATWFDDHVDALQDAYFHGRGGVAATLFEMQGDDALPFWLRCLLAPGWKTREEAALSLRRLAHRATDIVEHLRIAIDGETHEEARRTMIETLHMLVSARRAPGGG